MSNLLRYVYIITAVFDSLHLVRYYFSALCRQRSDDTPTRPCSNPNTAANSLESPQMSLVILKSLITIHQCHQSSPLHSAITAEFLYHKWAPILVCSRETMKAQHCSTPFYIQAASTPARSIPNRESGLVASVPTAHVSIQTRTANQSKLRRNAIEAKGEKMALARHAHWPDDFLTAHLGLVRGGALEQEPVGARVVVNRYAGRWPWRHWPLVLICLWSFGE